MNKNEMKASLYLDWTLPPEACFSNSNFDVTIKENVIRITADIQSYGCRNTAECTIPLDKFLAVVESIKHVEAQRALQEGV